MPSPLGVDTNLDDARSDKTGIEGIDAPFVPTASQPSLSPTPVLAALAKDQPAYGTPPAAQGSTGPLTGKRAKLVELAHAGVGVMYRWGGTSNNGWDCSGFVQNIYRHIGITLPRVSFQQVAAGERVPISQLKPGDLVGFDNSSRNNGADHISVYLGHGMIAEAYSTGHPTRIRRLGKHENAIGVSMQKYLGG